MALQAAVRVIGLGIATAKAAKAAKAAKKAQQQFEKAKEKSQAIGKQQKQDRLTNNRKNSSALKKQRRKAIEDLKIAEARTFKTSKAANAAAMAKTKAKYKK